MKLDPMRVGYALVAVGALMMCSALLLLAAFVGTVLKVGI